MNNCRQDRVGTSVSVDRRRILISATGLLGSTIMPLSSAWSQSSGCNIVSRMIVEARANADDPGRWMLSLDPLAVIRARDNVAKLKAEIKKLKGLVADKRRIQLLDSTDAVGGLLLLLSGVFLTAGPLIVSSIAFGGAMLVVRTVGSPMRVNEKDVLLNVAGSRLPAVFEAYGEGAGVVSKNAAAYGKLAGNVTGVVFVAYSFYQFAQSHKEFQSSTAELGRLEDALAGLEDDLLKLEDRNMLLEMRRACAQAVVDDLKALALGSCPGKLP